mmetsp:Transcript_7432/g.12142  ORF Transcript_7432/g.12142 Transcript_7432/m.12142 type:complete len:138 (-) Transcript_7432:7-420(-)
MLLSWAYGQRSGTALTGADIANLAGQSIGSSESTSNHLKQAELLDLGHVCRERNLVPLRPVRFHIKRMDRSTNDDMYSISAWQIWLLLQTIRDLQGSQAWSRVCTISLRANMRSCLGLQSEAMRGSKVAQCCNGVNL